MEALQRKLNYRLNILTRTRCSIRFKNLEEQLSAGQLLQSCGSPSFGNRTMASHTQFVVGQVAECFFKQTIVMGFNCNKACMIYSEVCPRLQTLQKLRRKKLWFLIWWCSMWVHKYLLGFAKSFTY